MTTLKPLTNNSYYQVHETIKHRFYDEDAIFSAIELLNDKIDEHYKKYSSQINHPSIMMIKFLINECFQIKREK